MKWFLRAVKPLAVQLVVLALQAAVDTLLKPERDVARPQPANDP